jgi:hypothetical protein
MPDSRTPQLTTYATLSGAAASRGTIMAKLAFETYVERVLTPELRQGDVVVMDNLSSHKGQKVRERIEAAGARLPILYHTAFIDGA